VRVVSLKHQAAKVVSRIESAKSRFNEFALTSRVIVRALQSTRHSITYQSRNSKRDSSLVEKLQRFKSSGHLARRQVENQGNVSRDSMPQRHGILGIIDFRCRESLRSFTLFYALLRLFYARQA